ncbi:hypothetical protein K2Z83_15080 [Oscillochloris sp. ZM17-4]|nr:hypothetical protein [Oscillochloris sp. ZM17-4]MBX0329000.1 hypothetical protein [Oscillochloris sp. ZM17-4]
MVERLEFLLTLCDQEELGGAQVKLQSDDNRPQGWLLNMARELDDGKRRMGKALGLALTQKLACIGG